MKKLLCFTVYPAEAPSVYHRIAAYKTYFAKEGIQLEIFSFLTPQFYQRRRLFGFRHKLYKMALFIYCCLRLIINIPRAYFADYVIIHREVFPLGPPWIEKIICSLSKHCAFDIDDALWFPPSNGIDQRAIFWDPNRISSIMKKADRVFAGSPYINDYAKKLCVETSIIPTAYENLLNNHTKTYNKIPQIIWVGNWGNAFYLTQVLPALERAAKSFAFKLVLVGAKDIYTIKSNTLDITYHLWTRPVEHETLLASDIGIMPLVDSRYEQGKCAFKLIQYMSAGLALIASPVGMNNSLVKNNMGILASSNYDWYAALTQMLANPLLRSSMGNKAYLEFKSYYSREVNAKRLIEQLHDGELQHA